MKKLISSMVLMLVAACSLLFSGCGDPYTKVSLSLLNGQELVLTMGDSETETINVDVKIENYSKALLSDINFSTDNNVVSIGEVTKYADGISRVKISAIRGGKATIKATMLDGGATKLFDVSVVEPIEDFLVNATGCYVVRGGDALNLNAQKLITFYPSTTTQTDIEFLVDNTPVKSVVALEQEEDSEITVIARSVSRPQLSKSFTIDVINGVSKNDDGSPKATFKNQSNEQVSAVELALNHSLNLQTFILEVESKDLNLDIRADETYSEYARIITSHKGSENNIHKFEISFMGMKAIDKFDQLFFVHSADSEMNNYQETVSIEIQVLYIPQSIFVNNMSTISERVVVYNYSALSRGTALNITAFPELIDKRYGEITITYDPSLIVIKNTEGRVLESGTKIDSGATIYVAGVSGVVSESASIQIGCTSIPEKYGREVNYFVPVKILAGVQELVGDANLCLSLSPTGEMAESDYVYTFSTVPASAYVGPVSIIKQSNNISVIQNAENYNQLLVRALAPGRGSFSINLPNGITKTIGYEIISSVEEDKLYIDMPTSLQNPYVGEHIPTVVSELSPLERVAIHKSINNEKPAKVYIISNPSNATIDSINCSQETNEQSINYVGFMQNGNNISIYGKETGTTNISIKINFRNLITNEEGKQIFENKSKIFTFVVEVYIPVESFYYSPNLVSVADKKSVGFSGIADATIKKKPIVYPANASYSSITYTMEGSDAYPIENGELYNGLVRFNPNTGVIIGDVDSNKFATSTRITASIIDHGNTYYSVLTVDIVEYEKVKYILLDNITDAKVGFSLSATEPTFQIKATAMLTTAHNRNLTYAYVPNNSASAGAISVSASGLVELKGQNFTPGFEIGGYIRIAPQDAYTTQYDASYYIDVRVVIETGSKENPYIISTTEDFLRIGNNESTLSYHYKLINAIDLSAIDFEPFGTFTGSIVGASASVGGSIVERSVAIISGLNLKKAKNARLGLFESVASGALIKNIKIIGSVEYTGDNVSCGLVAGDNYGTIENVSVQVVSFNVTVSGSATIGAVVGYNRNTGVIINNTSEQNNIKLVYAASSSFVMEVNALGNNVSVGGVTGVNDGVLSRVTSEGYFDANEDGYTSTISIKALNSISCGGAVGKNTGAMRGLRTAGNILGGDQVGGMVGSVNSSGDAGKKIEDCISNCFVKGDKNVGGFAGYVSGGIIELCGVEIYNDREFLGDYESVVVGNDEVSGFASSVIASNIKDSYFVFFGSGNDKIIRNNSDISSNMGSFCTYRGEDASVYSGCYSNATLFATSDQVVKNTNKVSDENRPAFPLLSTINAKKNVLSTDVEDEKIVFLANYYMAKNKSSQHYLDVYNTFNISDYLSGITGACFVDSHNKSIISNANSNQLIINNEGVAKLSIISKYDISRILYCYVVVSRYSPDFRLYVLGKDGEIEVGENLVFNIRKNEEIFITKGSGSYTMTPTEGVNVELDTDAPYSIKAELDAEFKESDSANELNIDNMENSYSISYNGTGSGKIHFSAYYSVTLNGILYKNEDVYANRITSNFNFYVGASEICFNVDEASMMPNDTIDISGYYVSDKENEELHVYGKGLIINGNEAQSNVSGVDGKFNIKVSIKNRNLYGDYIITVKDSNNRISKEFCLTVTPPNFETITMDFYSRVLNYSQDSLTSSNIIPGVQGLLKVGAFPINSKDECIIVENAETNAHNIVFELIKINNDGVFERVEGAVVTPRGLKIATNLLDNGQFFLRTLLPSNVNNNTKLNIIASSENTKKTLSLYTFFEEGVRISIKGLTGENGDLYVAKGVKYEIETNIVGYNFDQVVITSNNLSDAKITKDTEKQKFYVTFNTFATIQNGNLPISILASASKTVFGVNVTSPISTIEVKLVSYVINKLYIKNSVVRESDGANIIVSYVQNKYSLEFDLLNPAFVEYDASNSAVVNNLKELEKELNKNNAFKVVSETGERSWNNNDILTDLKLKTAYNSIISYFQAGVINDANDTAYSFVYSVKLGPQNGGIVKIDADPGEDYELVVIPSVLYQNNYDTPNPVYTLDELFSMEENKYYILMNNLSIDASAQFSPITTQIAGFDGNNNCIEFLSNARLNLTSNASIVYGLFANVGEGTIIQNVKLKFNSPIYLTSPTVVFGAVAGINNGSITNCEVLGDLIVMVSESAEYLNGAKTIGGLVGENYGYVTNSRLKTNLFETKGQMGGIVSYNQGVISACFVKETRILNGSALSSSKTGGVVHTNSQTGSILGSYIEGKKNNNSLLYCDNAEKAIISSNDLGAFVYSNMGKILNCYADIYVLSGAKASGFAFENIGAGSIISCYSTSRIDNQSSFNNAFLSIKPEEANGVIQNCYIWSGFDSVNHEGITSLSQAQFASTDSFSYFAFTSNQDKGVWTIKNGKPSLISANSIFNGKRELEEATQTSYYYGLQNEGATPDNPFIIDSAEKFERMILSGGSSGNNNKFYYRLICDIDYADIPNSKSNLYKINILGGIEGNGMTIKNISLGTDERLENGGLFASIGSMTDDAVVKDLTIRPKQVNFSSTRNVGCLAGSIIGGSVINVAVDGYETTSVIVAKGTNKVGGIAGNMTNGSINKANMIFCTSDISVNATAMNQSTNSSDVYSTALYIPSARINNYSALSYAGGIVGYCSSGSVTYCSISKNISIIAQIAGGIVGYVGGTARIANCDLIAGNQLSIKGVYSAGGVAGYNDGELINCISKTTNDSMMVSPLIVIFCGGIAGHNSGAITECEAKLNIVNASANYVGGLTGCNYGTILNCTYDGTSLFGQKGAGVEYGENWIEAQSDTIIINDGVAKYNQNNGEIIINYIKQNLD